MTKCWDGRYRFERGEEVSVKTGHPLAGQKGIIDSFLGDDQFGVILGMEVGPGKIVTFFGDALCLLPIAKERRDGEEQGGFMAKAIERHGEIEYELTLTRNEASTLMAMLCRVGGSPETTRRKYTDKIRIALDSLAHPPDASIKDLNGSLTFE